MGKPKPAKKSGSPLKISTSSLFHRRSKAGEESEESSSLSSPSPPPKKKTKSTKDDAKTKTDSKSSPKKVVKKVTAEGKKQKTSKSEPTTKTKVGTKAKTSSTSEKGKGGSTSSTSVKAGKGKVPPKVTKKGTSTSSSTKTKEKAPSKTPTKKVLASSKKTPPRKTVKKRSSQADSTTTDTSSVTSISSFNSSSSASRTTRSTSSSSRTPSPAQRTTRTSTSSKTPASAKKPPSPKKKSVTSTPSKSTKSPKPTAKSSKVLAKKNKEKAIKTLNKAKAKKPTKPKAKLKRMASLNAKAILEASFSFEPVEKKKSSPAGTPTKNPSSLKSSNLDLTSTSTYTNTGDGNNVDLKPLTLLFSSPQAQEPIIPSFSASAQKPGERKRKSSTTANKSNESNNSGHHKESTSSSTAAGRKNSMSGESSSKEDIKPKKSMSAGTSTETSSTSTMKSPKKVKVSSVSTSTSPFEMSGDNRINDGMHHHHHHHQHQEIGGQFAAEQSSKNRDAVSFVPYVPAGERSYSQVPFLLQGQDNSNTSGPSSHQGGQHTNHRHSTTSKQSKSVSTGSQAKERNQSVAPVAHYSSTVYQPAGPLIEPHKMVSTVLPVQSLPDSVRIPSDLKVTYQTHPPTSSVLSTSSVASSSSSKGSSKSTKHSSDGCQHHQRSSSSSGTASAGCQTIKQSSKQLLHQPYKSSTSGSSSSVITRPVPETVSASSFAVPGNSMSSPGLHSQQQPGVGLSSSSSQGTSIYYGYAGSHQSPFAPSKFPIVPPDSFRTPSPYPSSFLYTPTPGTPQPSPNYMMTPFYTPPLTPNTASTIAMGIGQPRALLAAHHPTASAGATYFQSGPPPAAHPASSYYLAAPSLQPAHHTIPSASAPGHAGRSHPNQSSLACPTECSPRNNNSTSNSSSSFNSNKTNKQQPKRRQQQRTTDTQAVHQGQGFKSMPFQARNSKSKNSSHTSVETTANTKTFRLQNNSNSSYPTQSKKFTTAKIFTEQYSLPDDITITPIIMNPKDGKSLPFSQCDKIPERKKKDVVHLIDPRSGQTTTVAKHISKNNIVVNNNSSFVRSRNCTTSGRTNTGNVGKISPDLDVILIGGAAKKDFSSNQPQNLSLNRTRKNSFTVLPVNHSTIPPGSRKQGATFATNSNINSMGLTVSSAKSENKIKRKGLTLSECIDGLQRKKLRILADTNISITNVTPNNNSFVTGNLSQGQISMLPGAGSIFQYQQQKPGRKPNKPRQRSAKATIAQKCAANFNRTVPKDSDVGSTIINSKDAIIAASALVVPQEGYVYPLMNMGPRKGNPDGRKPLKLKISACGGKITTRSTTQNAKVKTRAKAAVVGRQVVPKVSPGQVDRGRLIHFTKTKGNKIVNTIPGVKFPAYFTTLNSKDKGAMGNGSSTMTTVNNHVILRIPKNSTNPGAKSKNLLKIGSWPNSNFQASTSGNMALAAMKKRAVVKPLSTAVLNGSLGSLPLPLVNRKALPTHTHPRWSNGWTFEGKSFEAKVHLSNDDPPVFRRCYNLMRHDGGDVIRPRDCVLLKSGPRKTDLPFVAKVAALWENPADGEMMFSLLWYYRPEHTEIGRLVEDMPDELFASKHRDSNSVATIEDKCYVLTFNEYCRYRRRLKELQEHIPTSFAMVPLSANASASSVSMTNFASNIAMAVWSGLNGNVIADQHGRRVPIPGKVSPEVVFFCRKVYDFRQKRMLKNPS